MIPAINMPESAQIIIEGVTQDGKKFRPSDWAERMCGALSTYGRDHRISYSPLLHPTTINGISCISVAQEMRQNNPEMFSYLMEFARSNRLNVIGLENGN